MRKTIWIAIASAALFAGACKKKDESAREMDRAGTAASKAQENIHDQSKDVQRAQQDLNKDQADVHKQQGELDSAKADLGAARGQYRDAAKQRLARLDDDIHQLEARTDALARTTAGKLRADRDAISTKLSAIGDQTQANWDAFKNDVDDRFDRAEKDARDALDKPNK